jgi:long-chain acyl-CoA synthetase
MNLKQKFEETVERFAQCRAIQSKKDGRWHDYSYRQLGDHVASLAAWLHRRGVGKGDRVALVVSNRAEWPMLFFATVSLGAIVVPINPEAHQREVENIVKDAQCKIVFTDSVDTYPFIQDVIAVDSPTFTTAITASSQDIPAPTTLAPSDTACILYTSGTTDEPKGVVLSHRNFLANCEALYQLGLIKQGDSVFSILPLHHAYPLTVTMLLPLLFGVTIIYPRTIRSEELLQTMQEANPTFFVAVPQVFYLFYQHITDRLKRIPFPFNFLCKGLIESLYVLRKYTTINSARFILYSIHRRFGRSLRFFGSGGAKLDEDVAKMLFKLGFTILEGYGLTETAPVLTMNPPQRPKIGSVGVPVPGVTLLIKDKDKNGVGEVIVRGANVMVGYYKRSEATAEVIRDGWFHTGDLGYLDSDGYLFLTGRSKDVIVLSSGLNIHPDEIEQAYMQQAPVKEMCVFDTAAPKSPEQNIVLWAVVVPDLKFFRKYGEVNLRSVIKERFDNVSRELPPHKRIMGFSVTLEELPRTLLGKVKRFAVKEMYTPKVRQEDSELKPQELSEDDRHLVELPSSKKILSYLKKRTGVTHDIAIHDSLEIDLGIDSLGRIELASGLEKEFKMRINNEVIGSSFTVKDLLRGIDALLKEGVEALPERERGIASGPDYWRQLLEVLPREENLKKIELHPGFGMWLINFVVSGFVYGLFKIFYSFRVEGGEHLPKKGPCLIYANHVSYFDGFLMFISLPRIPQRDVFFVGFRPYFNVPVIRNLIKTGRVIPLDLSSHLIEALRSCSYVLRNAKTICVFPEGIRSLDGTVREFKKGFGILAKESSAVLLPAVIEGAYEAWPRTSRFPKHHPITVRFGEAVTSEQLEKEGFRMGAHDSYDAICMASRNALIKLKDGTTPHF